MVTLVREGQLFRRDAPDVATPRVRVTQFRIGYLRLTNQRRFHGHRVAMVFQILRYFSQLMEDSSLALLNGHLLNDFGICVRPIRAFHVLRFSHR